MKLPLNPEHAEEEKEFFFYICKRITVCDSAGRSCLYPFPGLSQAGKGSAGFGLPRYKDRKF